MEADRHRVRGEVVDEADAFGVTTSPRTNAASFAVAFVLGFVSHRRSR